MPVKKGNGGHGDEPYDPSTGKYVSEGGGSDSQNKEDNSALLDNETLVNNKKSHKTGLLSRLRGNKRKPTNQNLDKLDKNTFLAGFSKNTLTKFKFAIKSPEEQKIDYNNLPFEDFMSYYFKKIDPNKVGFDDAWSHTNRHNYRKSVRYTVNCQQCAQTFVLRMLGWDVEAQPLPEGAFGYLGDKSERLKELENSGWIYSIFSGGINKSFDTYGNIINNMLDVMMEGTMINQIDRGNKFCDTTTGEEEYQNATKIVENSPDGSIFFYTCYWDSGDGVTPCGGHIFIATKQNGKAVFLDPQTGGNPFIDSYGQPDNYFKRMLRNKSSLTRVDNLKINPKFVRTVCRSHNGEDSKHF